MKTETHMHGTSSWRAWLIALVVVAFIFRLGFCAVETGLGRSSVRGWWEYGLAAQRLLERGTFITPLTWKVVDRSPSVLMPPAYVLIVAGAYGMLGVESFAATLTVQITNALATALCVAGVFYIVQRMVGRTPAWVAATLMTINPLLIGFTPLIWDTNLFALGVVITIWSALRLSSEPVHWCRWVAYGVWLGGLALLNPALTVAYPFLVIWPLRKVYRWQPRPIARGIALTVIGWLVAIAPWTVRNYVQDGRVTYIRGGFGLELWLGVCPEAETHGAAVYASQFPLFNRDVENHVGAIGEKAFIEECGRKARQAILDDPVRYLRLVGRRTVDYWFGTLYARAQPDGRGIPGNTTRRAVTLFVSSEVVIVAACFIMRRRKRVEPGWLLATVASFSIVYCLTHAQIRFRAPIEPVMTILVVVLVTDVYRARVESHQKNRPV